MTKKELAEKIYQEFGPRLKNFIGQRVADPQEVEEIFQQTVIAAVEAYSFFSRRSSLLTWICGIAKHEVSDYFRKKKIKTIIFSHFPWLKNLASEALGPEQQMLQKEFEQKVKASLTSLGEGYEEILRLKYYRHLSMAQIAYKLNATLKAVESKLFRARKAFAKVFLADVRARDLSSVR